MSRGPSGSAGASRRSPIRSSIRSPKRRSTSSREGRTGARAVRLLLDTAVFLWLAEGDASLEEAAREAVTDPENDVLLSAASAWEIAIKQGLGRLDLRVPPEDYVPQQRRLHRVESLPISEEATLQVGKLPDLHRDPFDRLLVAQAIVHGLTIVTPDRAIKGYPVPTLWEQGPASSTQG